MQKASESSYVVITGALGFIGTNIVREFNKKKMKNLILVDHLTEAKEKNLKGVLYANYYDKKTFISKIKKNSLPKISTIIHMGACSDTKEYDKTYLKNNNYEYSRLLFNYSVKNNCNFVYASSGSVYGDGKRGYSENLKNLHPLNPYGYYKYLFDTWVIKQKKKPIQWVGLRFFNVYGPYEDHKKSMASVIFHGFNQIKKSGTINLFKSYNKKYHDGMQLRDFVYVKDVVAVINFFLTHPTKSGIFNVGTGKARTFVDLAKATFHAAHKKESIFFIDMPSLLRNKYQYFTQANIKKLRNVGYKKAFTSLEKGVKEYVKTYLQKHT